MYSSAREMGTVSPWEDSVGAPRRPIQVTDGESVQPTERDGPEPIDVERDSGSSQSAADPRPTQAEDKGTYSIIIMYTALLCSGYP